MVESQEDKVYTIEDEEPDASDLAGTEYEDLDDFPGPFWRDNGAASIIIKSLDEIKELLTKMIEEWRVVKKKLQAFYAEFPFFDEYTSPYEQDALAQEVFYEIIGDFRLLEHDLACCTRTAILMAAIDLETCVNRFCYFNLDESTTNEIERLNPTEKLTIIHKVLGLGDFKGTSQYEAVKALVNWRNAFAHGKCTDMPTRSLKDNHLSEPQKRPKPGDRLHEVIKCLKYYDVVYSHLNETSEHSYTSGHYHSDLRFIESGLEDLRTLWKAHANETGQSAVSDISMKEHQS